MCYIPSLCHFASTCANPTASIISTCTRQHCTRISVELDFDALSFPKENDHFEELGVDRKFRFYEQRTSYISPKRACLIF